jgi:hypothetical protein
MDTSLDSDALLQALEKSCSLWEEAKSSCDEALRLYQVLASMLSSCQLVARTSSSQAQTPEPPFEFPGFSPQFQPINGSLSCEKSFMSNEMDIDWVGHPILF